MTDDWKGEHFIRRRPSPAERRETTSALTNLIQATRRKTERKIKTEHRRFVSSVFLDLKKSFDKLPE